MKSKSCDIRETAIMAVINKTMSVPQAAEVFGVHRSTIYSWVSFFKKEGRFAAKSPTGRKPRLTEDDKNTLKQLLERQKDITIDELTEALGNIVHRSTVHRYVVALGYVYKKTLKAEEQGREDVIAARLEWLRFQKLITMEHIVCLDESAAKTNMTRLYGRAMGGKRCFDTAPDSRWKTTTMLSSLRCDGTTACMVYEGGTTREIFEIYIEQLLCPTLKPGDHVLMDNLASHKSARVSQLIENCGAQVHYLPPYSPDLNPIEKMWSKMKAILRKLKPRSGESLFEAIKEAFARITHADAKNWFLSCGYLS